MYIHFILEDFRTHIIAGGLIIQRFQQNILTDASNSYQIMESKIDKK